MDMASGGYDVTSKGTIHPWNKDTISVPEIRELGGFPSGSSVVAVDLADNSETPLPEDAVHAVIKHGEGKPLVKKMCFNAADSRRSKAALRQLSAARLEDDFGEKVHLRRVGDRRIEDELVNARIFISAECALDRFGRT